NRNINSEFTFDFEGTGIVLLGSAHKDNNELPEYVFSLDWYIDGETIDTFERDTAYSKRRNEIFWNYQLPKGKHAVRVVITNPRDGYRIWVNNYVVYSDTPVEGMNHHDTALGR